MPFPVLRERQRHGLVDDMAGAAFAADVTAPLPIFRDAVAFRRPSIGTGLVPMHNDSTGYARREVWTGRHRAAWIADQDTAADGIRDKRGRHARPEAADESHAGNGTGQARPARQ